jgi:hypothetical protein
VDLDIANIRPPRSKGQKYKDAKGSLDIEVKRDINM